MDVRECPSNSFGRQSPGNLRVLINVGVVIKIDELKTKRLAKDQPSDRSNETANPENLPAIARDHGLLSDSAGLGSAAHWARGTERIKSRSRIARENAQFQTRKAI